MGPAGNARAIEGAVDDVAIFKRGLSAEESETLMEKGLEKLFGFQAVDPRGKLAITWATLKVE